jgi:hypothetical protein
MDDTDLASLHEEQLTELAMRCRKPVPEHTGRCLNCDASLLHNGAFCDALCREDHERRSRAQDLA